MKSKLIYKNQITPSIIEVDLELAESVNFMPGQYVNVTVGEPFRRPYSVTSYEEKTLKILVGNGNPGKGADFFTKAEIGMIIEISVPMGEFGIKDNTEKSIFIATGSGLAPFITMIKSLNSAPVFLLYGIKNYDEDLSQIFLKDIQGLEIVRCVSDQSEDLQNKLDQKGRLTKYLKENEFDWKDANVYICGRNEMIKDVTDILKSKNISNIYKENYG